MKTMNEEKVMSLAKENIEIDGVMRTRSVMMTLIQLRFIYVVCTPIKMFL